MRTQCRQAQTRQATRKPGNARPDCFGLQAARLLVERDHIGNFRQICARLHRFPLWQTGISVWLISAFPGCRTSPGKLITAMQGLQGRRAARALSGLCNRFPLFCKACSWRCPCAGSAWRGGSVEVAGFGFSSRSVAGQMRELKVPDVIVSANNLCYPEWDQAGGAASCP
jgi:hypothetical protein